MSFWDFFTGTRGKVKQYSTLSPAQQALQNQQISASMGRGAGGAFGEASDYYRNLLGNESQDLEAFQAPEMRRYREQTIPDLAEQFAGYGSGSGSLSSSGFRNAAVSAGTDLGERLAQIRANLRQSAAQGLSGMGESALQSRQENVFQPGTQGLLSSLGPAIGAGIGAFANPWGAAGGFGSSLSKLFSPGREVSPYGGPDIGGSKYYNPYTNKNG